MEDDKQRSGGFGLGSVEDANQEEWSLTSREGEDEDCGAWRVRIRGIGG